MKTKIKKYVQCIMLFTMIIAGIGNILVVYGAENKQIIYGFVDYRDELYFEKATKPELSQILDMLPDHLTAYVGNERTPRDICVTWECVGEDYDNSNSYFFQLSPVWDEQEYELSDSIDVIKDAPYVFIFLFDVTNQGTENRASVSENEKYIYDFLTGRMELNTAAACGILANIYKESSFNPNASYMESNGYLSYGICQWNAGRYNNLVNFCGENGYDYKTLEGQLNYLKYELSQNNYKILYNGKTIYNYMKGVENSGEGAYDGGYYWCYYFEVPANRANSSVTRGNLAKNTYWEKYRPKNNGLCNENGEWIYYVDGVVQSDFTGLVKYEDDNLYYVSKGKIDFSYYGICEYEEEKYCVAGGLAYKDYSGAFICDNKVYAFKDGRIDKEYKGLIKSPVDDIWFYVKAGISDYDYRGLVFYVDSWFYVQQGKVDFNYTGLAEYEGEEFYVVKGMLALAVNDCVQCADENGNVGRYAINSGWVNSGYTGLVYCSAEEKWYYVTEGKVDENYNSLTEYLGYWYYVENGCVNFAYSGLCSYAEELFYISGGVMDTNISGNYDIAGTLYVINNGWVNSGYTGLAQGLADGQWYYVEKGKSNYEYTGLCYFIDSWFYVNCGKVDWSYTGLCFYEDAWFYVSGGILDWNYTGTCMYEGYEFAVNKGIVTGLA